MSLILTPLTHPTVYGLRRHRYLCDTDAFLKGSLSTSSGEPVDLALVYTCKMVAEETEYGNVALSFNTVTFTTLHSPELGDLARVFQKLMFDGVRFVKAVIFNAVGYYLSKKSVAKLKDRYPQFAPLVDRMKDEEPATGDDLLNLARDRQGLYGEAPSVYWEFVDETLRLAADDPEASPAVRDFVVPWNPRPRGHYDPPPAGLVEHQRRKLRSGFEIIDDRTKDWEIPSPSDLEKLTRLLKYTVRPVCPEAEVKQRFSAAAAAIYFLKSMSPHTCRHLRKLVILEDKRSLCNPESHALGLIPFCRDYPKLQVERRVKLFTNVFLRGVTYEGRSERAWFGQYRQEPKGDLFSLNMTAAVAPWIIEASRLVEAGMPPGSFSLLLDSDGAGGLASQIFESVVHRDVAWQEAWFATFANGPSDLAWFDIRGDRRHSGRTPHFNHYVTPEDPARRLSWRPRPLLLRYSLNGGDRYLFENLPRAVRDIVEGKSITRCDFNPGTMWDVQAPVRQHEG
ncbi:hypothetical protein CPLU01_13344 [Colletotrichum plurivorum]|uniref:Uncharacterized protein n=1 Tax=Colletotrichum plurivorum TaxID=2175906 RepID=A0A8H6N3N9_9PEZI|nr:hypothetical protein CPLU01_13344 [Colletotrichum plurivorum]